MKRLSFFFLFLFLTINYQQSTVIAAPPNPLIYDTGPLSPEMQSLVTKPRIPVPMLPAESVRQSVITTGTAKIIVLLIEFTDVKRAASHTKAFFDNMLFSKGLGYGSMEDYYKENSDNHLNLTGTTGANWYESDHTMAWYGGDFGGIDNATGSISRLVVEAIQKADNDIDFSQYDTNGDGFVDHLIIVHAGYGQENSGNTNDIWSHSGDFTYSSGGVLDPDGYLTNDGVHIKNYTMLSEYSEVGIFCHEFAHDLGLPDLYNTLYYGGRAVVGDWDLMDGGSWLGPTHDGSIPGHISAWGKVRLGWVTPNELTDQETNIQVATSGSSSIFKIPVMNAADPVSEYFLVENRQQQNFDRYLPGAGLLIWHIDDAMLSYATTDSDGNTGTALELNLVNSEPKVPHRAVRLMEADNNNALNQAGDPFPGTKDVTSLSSSLSDGYNGKPATFSLLNMGTGAGDLMVMNFYQAIFNKALSITSTYNAPNPAPGGRTKIKLILTQVLDAGEISLKIFNVAGELVREARADEIITGSIASNKAVYEFSWDGKNNSGSQVASGVYIYFFQAGNQQQAGKIAVIK